MNKWFGYHLVTKHNSCNEGQRTRNGKKWTLGVRMVTICLYTLMPIPTAHSNKTGVE